jgi:hypothetical protein
VLLLLVLVVLAGVVVEGLGRLVRPRRQAQAAARPVGAATGGIAGEPLEHLLAHGLGNAEPGPVDPKASAPIPIEDFEPDKSPPWESTLSTRLTNTQSNRRR